MFLTKKKGHAFLFRLENLWLRFPIPKGGRSFFYTVGYSFDSETKNFPFFCFFFFWRAWLSRRDGDFHAMVFVLWNGIAVGLLVINF